MQGHEGKEALVKALHRLVIERRKKLDDAIALVARQPRPPTNAEELTLESMRRDWTSAIRVLKDAESTLPVTPFMPTKGPSYGELRQTQEKFNYRRQEEIDDAYWELMGKKAIESSCWSWQRGMIDREGRTLFFHKGEEAFVWSCEGSGNPVPDFQTPATVGGLVALTRSLLPHVAIAGPVWGSPKNGGPPERLGWHVCMYASPGKAEVIGRGSTEPEAWVAVLVFVSDMRSTLTG